MKYLSSLKDKNLSGKICLLRVDFNVQQADLRGKIPLRIKAILGTIKFLLKKKAKVVIMSHRGRPKSSDRNDSKFSLKPFARIVSGLIKKPVRFIKNLDPIDYAKADVFLLENLRFFPGEEKNDKKFAKKLAFLGDFFVNDAFGVSHRRNASVAAITEFLPSYAGLCLENELKNLNKALKKPKHPFVIILGGAKISDKIGIIENFMKKPARRSRGGGGADKFLIGGGIANTFFAAQKMPMGDSLYEKDKLAFAKKLSKSSKIILPIDLVFEKNRILDIGPATRREYSRIIRKAKTVVWNGPMGYIENPEFSRGSKAIAKAILESRAFSVIGGGETVAVFQTTLRTSQTKRGITQKKLKFSVSQREVRVSPRIFISTGGGAMLDYLAGKKLPGIISL